MALVTRADAAREMGVTVQAVYKAIREGRLTPIDAGNGKIVLNSDTMNEEWGKKTVKRVRKTASAKAVRTEDVPTYEESKARTEFLKAELLELERRQKEQILVPTAEIESKWVKVVTLARTKVLGIPSKAKQRIPDLDTSAMTCLEDIVREALEDIASSDLQVA